MTRASRRQFLQGGLSVAGLSVLAGCRPLAMPGQPTIRRVGYLDYAGIAAPAFDAWRLGMRELGYVEGQSLVIETRSAEGIVERLPALAAELVSLPVDVIVVTHNDAAVAASRATSSIPIVAAGANVVAAGLVTNIAHPGGNVTGVTTNSVEVVGKWIELLKETVPAMSHLAALIDLGGPPAQAFVPVVQRAAENLQLRLTQYDLRDLNQLAVVLATARADGVDGLVVVSGGVLAGGTDPRIGSEVLKASLPGVAERQAFAANGGLLAHGSDNNALGRRSAAYVDKILKGAQPGDLPIELPTTFDIIVNVKSAQELGIAIPQSILAQATEVIQ